jgi:hypothetical protein
MVRFQVLAAFTKMAVFWDVAPYSLVETDRRFRGALLSPSSGPLSLENRHNLKEPLFFGKIRMPTDVP